MERDAENNLFAEHILAEGSVKPKRKGSRGNDNEKHRTDAEERQAGQLVSMANAAVVVWDETSPEVYRLVAMLQARGVPVLVIC